MDIAFDRKSWTNDPAGQAGGSAGTPEWHGLLARLAAARATSDALAEQECAVRVPGVGSFDCGSARALSDFAHPLPAVNPVFWVNGKSARPMEMATADEINPGGRG
jgi:hypothetical protein